MLVPDPQRLSVIMWAACEVESSSFGVWVLVLWQWLVLLCKAYLSESPGPLKKPSVQPQTPQLATIMTLVINPITLMLVTVVIRMVLILMTMLLCMMAVVICNDAHGTILQKLCYNPTQARFRKTLEL